MATEPPSGDLEQLAAFADRLAAAIETAAAPWVRHCVAQRCPDAGRGVDRSLDDSTERAAEACAAELAPAVRELLRIDIDEQQTTPLALVRAAVTHPTGVLRRAGVAPSERDEFARRSFPDDDYDLTPATFTDLGEPVAEAALMWGAAKAHVHLARRRAEGLR